MDQAIIERTLGRRLARRSDVVAAYLFGSRARGDARARSDIDLAVLLENEPTGAFARLGLELEAELEKGLDAPLQVVILNRAPVDLVHRVLRDGKLIVERDPSARIRFEVKARNEFFDLLPILHRYRRQEGFGG